MGDTKISWAEKTWNPAIGCSPASPGCDHCYAAAFAASRLSHLPDYQGLTVRHPGSAAPEYTGEVRLLPDRLDEPAKWKKPSRIFVGSMTDLFHEQIPDEFIADVLGVVYLNPQHTFLVLTKRIQRAADVIPWFLDGRVVGRNLPNLWLGTSIESGKYGFRSRHLAAIRGCNHFLSIEPLIGPLTASQLTWEDLGCVIVGGESGSNARPMHPDWVSDIFVHARKVGVPLEFKQWGEWIMPTKELEKLKLPTQRTIWFGDNAQIVDSWDEARELAAANRTVFAKMERVGKRLLNVKGPDGVTPNRMWNGREWNGSVVMSPRVPA